jgi:hypothetical protein
MVSSGRPTSSRVCRRSSTPTLLQDKQAMSEAVANVRWLIAAGVRDFQAMLEELGKLQTGLPRDAPAPDEPTLDD